MEDLIMVKSLDFLGFSNYKVSSDGCVWRKHFKDVSDEDILKIKNLYFNANVSSCQIAKNYTISRRTISRIINYNDSNWVLLKPDIDKDGYLVVRLSNDSIKKRFFIHQLVLLAFIGPPKFMEQCRHLNGIRDDNRLENLKWGTSYENNQDRILHGTVIKGSKHASSKLNELDIVVIRKLYKLRNTSQKELANIYNVSTHTMNGILNYKSWTHVQ